MDNISANIAEVKTLLVQAYSGRAYKSKINLALHRLTEVERIIAKADRLDEAAKS
jgi:hypothetical protein